MPLFKIQSDVLRLLASHRDPESYVAGASALNRNAPRYSSDIDVFHDREERVALAAMGDAKALKFAGYQVAWLRQLPLIYAAERSRTHSSAGRLGLGGDEKSPGFSGTPRRSHPALVGGGQ